MQKLSAVVFAVLVLPTLALAADFKNVPMVDTMCQQKVKADTDKHPVSCALKCADSGYSIQASDGKWLKLDDAGNKLAVSELKATKKKDHIRVNVSGDLKGDSLAVSSLKMAD
jgi:hypothetical protein